MKILKKILSVILSVVLCFSAVSALAAESGAGSRITSAKTPVSASQANLKWSIRLGKSYKDAPAPPIAVGDTLIVMSGKTTGESGNTNMIKVETV